MRYAMVKGTDSSHPAIVETEAVRLLGGVRDLAELIAMTPAQRAALVLGEPHPLATTTLDAPLRPRKNVFCVGRNYLGHAEEVARANGQELKLPPVPTFFTKAPTAIAAPGATLHLEAALSAQYDYEAELAVVIGARCKDVDERSAHEVIFGYTCLNDVTARDLQREHGQWFKGKSLDDACPIGPWIVTADEIPEPGSLSIALRRGGEIKQQANTNQLIFSIPKLIASLSRGMTLEPGDVIATGTPDGVGFARTPPEFLRDGDLLEVEIERIGILRNRIAIG